ncbi:hypothetical protein BGP75_06175 [Motiliproteus sp. MSK22-1]|nr:hypothetical protein BGP75_06175 [Motiliproteus sp. MSK22-1]
MPLLLTAPLLLIQTTPLDASELPVIGDTTSSTITLEEEHKLGKAWARALRAQARQLNDPLVYSYIEDLIYQLASNSDLPDRRLTLIVLNNPTLNAFAVPGGIVGIHAGLFQYAQTEGQFASVLAHELSHLSQRHYATSLEQQRKSLPLQLATMLGGIILAANSDGDGAIAAIASGQAAFQQQRLAFSRQNEREADNLGMQVLMESGFNPITMPDMFMQMQKSFRFAGEQAPEFLLTHPVTESRIADSQGRAAQLPSTGKIDSLSYQLIRGRISTILSKDTHATYQYFTDLLKDNPGEPAHYAKAFAALNSEQPEAAQASIDWLLQKDSENLYYKILQSELWLAEGKPEKASAELRELLSLYPQNHPLTVLLIRSLRAQQKNNAAVEVLRKHLRSYPENTNLWYELAEANGLTDNILGVHQARAEYFLLIGATAKAESHLKLALKLPNISENDRVRLEQRLKETHEIKKSMEF